MMPHAMGGGQGGSPVKEMNGRMEVAALHASDAAAPEPSLSLGQT